MLKLCIDCGHGLNTAGKQTLNGSRGIIKEWTLNNNVYKHLKELLKDYDVEIKTTFDLTGKIDTPLSERCKISNNYKPDLFISIHHNAFNGEWGNHTGTSVYIHPNASNKSKEIANAVAPILSKNTGLRNRGVITSDFYVLRNTNAPAILIEGGFMDSNCDYPVITSSEGQLAYAKAILEGLLKVFHIVKKQTATPNNTTSDNTYYRVIAGSYTVRDNADKQLKQLNKLGYNAFIAIFNKDNKTYYRVVVGSFKDKSNADKQVKTLSDKGFNAFIEVFHK